MADDLVASAAEAIEREYKSLGSPDFSFVRKSISRRPYAGVVAALEKTFEIEDITDINDDVSFRYHLKRAAHEWVVELSMVGPYANVFRLAEINRSKLIVAGNAAPEDQEILALLAGSGLTQLSKTALQTPISLKLFNTDEGRVTIYQALFSDTAVLPWQRAGDSI